MLTSLSDLSDRITGMYHIAENFCEVQIFTFFAIECQCAKTSILKNLFLVLPPRIASYVTLPTPMGLLSTAVSLNEEVSEQLPSTSSHTQSRAPYVSKILS